MCIDIKLFKNPENIPSIFICPIGGGVIDKIVAFKCGPREKKREKKDKRREDYYPSEKKESKKQEVVPEKTFMHIFCEDCMLKALQYNNCCPICKTYQSIDSAIYLPYEDNFKYELSCTNNNKGCTWEGSLEQYVFHNSQCSYFEEICRRCDQVYFLKDKEEHHKNVCNYRKVNCDNCNNLYFYLNKDDHIQQNIKCEKCSLMTTGCCKEEHTNECPEEIISCSISSCDEKIERKNLEKHIQESLAQHMIMLSKYVNASIQKKKIIIHSYSSECACDKCDIIFRKNKKNNGAEKKSKKKSKKSKKCDSDWESDSECEIMKKRSRC